MAAQTGDGGNAGDRIPVVCIIEDTFTRATCIGSEMTVAISCFLYYFVLLANLSKNVPGSKPGLRSERKSQPL